MYEINVQKSINTTNITYTCCAVKTTNMTLPPVAKMNIIGNGLKDTAINVLIQTKHTPIKKNMVLKQKKKTRTMAITKKRPTELLPQKPHPGTLHLHTDPRRKVPRRHMVLAGERVVDARSAALRGNFVCELGSSGRLKRRRQDIHVGEGPLTIRGRSDGSKHRIGFL